MGIDATLFWDLVSSIVSSSSDSSLSHGYNGKRISSDELTIACIEYAVEDARPSRNYRRKWGKTLTLDSRRPRRYPAKQPQERHTDSTHYVQNCLRSVPSALAPHLVEIRDSSCLLRGQLCTEYSETNSPPTRRSGFAAAYSASETWQRTFHRSPKELRSIERELLPQG